MPDSLCCGEPIVMVGIVRVCTYCGLEVEDDPMEEETKHEERTA